MCLPGAPLNPPMIDSTEDPHPSLSDWHDYEPNLEFDDTELTHPSPEPGTTTVFDDINYSGTFVSPNTHWQRSRPYGEDSFDSLMALVVMHRINRSEKADSALHKPVDFSGVEWDTQNRTLPETTEKSGLC